jgi:hypothetical protein
MTASNRGELIRDYANGRLHFKGIPVFQVSRETPETTASPGGVFRTSHNSIAWSYEGVSVTCKNPHTGKG